MEENLIQDGQPRDAVDLRIRDCFQTIGISFLCEWDAAIFLYRHGACLSSADQIARWLVYGKAEMSAALEKLESMALIRRSRSAHGLRIYTFAAPADSSVRECWQELMTLAETRSGRLLLMQNLRRISVDTITRRSNTLYVALKEIPHE